MKEIKGLKVLERQDFERFCPSFYATAPKHDVSDRYAFLNTRDIAVQLYQDNWYPVYAQEQLYVKNENRGLTKHVVRWANPDFSLNGDRIELVGTNSHNRASAFTFSAGIFRLVCTNGMVVKSADFGEFKVRHTGNIAEQVHSAVKGISENAGKIASRVGDFKTIDMSPDEQGIFAAAAHHYIYADNEGNVDNAPIKYEQFLRPRRLVDRNDTKGAYGAYALPKPDLWTTFNVVQENVTKGGLRGFNRAKYRRVTTRPIKSIDKDLKLNKALWQLAEKFAELKNEGSRIV